MEQDTRAPLEELVRRSGLIFAGTVLELGKSSVPSIKPAANLAVVRVDRGLRVDKVLGELRGRTITVEVRDRKAFQPGQQVVFFTNSLVHGQGIAVREIDHAGMDAQDRVSAAVARLPEARVIDRLRLAVLVVHAEVVHVGPVLRVSLDRNDALWRTAELKVIHSFRGTPHPPTVVYFPTSTHPEWASVPRFTERQRGIFILQSAAGSRTPTLAALPPGALVVLDHDDFQPESRLLDVEKLLASIK